MEYNVIGYGVCPLGCEFNIVGVLVWALFGVSGRVFMVRRPFARGCGRPVWLVVGRG